MRDAASPACLDADTADSYAEHRLPAAEQLEVERHIDECESCRELISALAKTRWSQSSQPGSDDAEPLAGGVLARGTRVGPFEIDQPLDAGGMGLVYAAHDVRLDRRVALKGVRDHRGRSEQLLREARTMARLAHPNIVPVFDVIEAHGQIFLAMELVVGRSGRQWLAEAPRGWKAVVDVFLAAGAGLAAAHEAGIVHGDVKPANMLVGDDGRVRITDFGLSSGGDETASGAGLAAGPRGTPAYMAPAQRDGVPCDQLGDQYAFCASLHEAIFGALPGAAPTRQPRLPRALRRIVARGLAHDPSARHRSMKLLLRRLRAIRAARWRWVLAAAVVTLTIGVSAYASGGRRVQARMCQASAPNLISPWNAEARWGLERSFRSTGLPYAPQIVTRVEAKLDAWTGEFEAARREACEPGWLGSEPSLDRLSSQLGCLEDRAREASALVGLFRGPADATIVRNAVAATEQLSPPARCSTRSTPRAVTSVSLVRRALSDRFARGFALMAAGRPGDALPISRELVQAAEATGDPDVLCAALLSLGKDQLDLSDHEAAAGSLLEAIRVAEIAQNDRVRVGAWVNLVMNEYRRGNHDQVQLLKAPALGAMERLGDPYLKSELLLAIGASQSQLGKLREAQAQFEEAVRLRRQLYGDKNALVAAALTALGNAYAMQGNLDAGIAAHRQAVDIAEAALGSAHPDVGTMHGNLGDDYLYGLRIDAAIAELDQAAATFEAAFGPRHRNVASALTDLGLALVEAGQYERAAATCERADALWGAVTPEHPARGEALLGRHLALEALGRPTRVEDLETALTLGQRLPPFERARIQFALARASSGAKATELMKAAIEGLASSSLPLIQRELARAKAWQRQRGGAP